MPLSDADVPVVVQLLSEERLKHLINLTDCPRAAIRLHQESLSLGAALMNVMGVIEIALRNSICQNLEQHFGAHDWLLNPPSPFAWKEPEQSKALAALDNARRAEYSKLTQAEKTALDALAFPNGRPEVLAHLQRSKKRRRYIDVTHGKVVAELTLYFWKRLYGPDYEQTLWRTTLKKTFPNKSLKRADVAEQLERVYQARNRLAHHEPVLHKRFEDTMRGVHFVIENLGIAKPGGETALARLLAFEIAEVKSRACELHDRLAAYRSESSLREPTAPLKNSRFNDVSASNYRLTDSPQES